ncbi:MAG: hypothetical protein A2X34_07495 [Elusimicrobia bacterium GWC2_51_8]|nr:MAG: hypothetical protein A2X33_05430 [Elusimicrobia bacterium GWA2_51_34]OGR64269.1 MAG: hypothetical protein A2X34_07495 [Elusimicrobia bacterium GWC2_51_8]OGR87947.1 MAG: hypothetical protein A2021_07675 [Elusimicrobia bacterium GWF2_52_66]HAF96020.1 hypothetical protein [Elusimicrobiota bacterium]HCE96983.1 hypothetical protein [Elusimicrobiota bacterium]
MEKNKGQVLVGAIILLAVLAIIVPAMVMYIRNETKWSMKQAQNSNAFQLVEGALDRGYQKVTESTATWTAIKNGQALTGFDLSTPTAYTDLDGGSYTIGITSGTETGTVVITAIARDKNLKETRALKAVYANSVMGNISIVAADGVAITGNNIQVEWGAVTSPKTVDTGGKNHPSFWSANDIQSNGVSLDTDGPGGNNCDPGTCWWWHSYQTQLPPFPAVNTEGYKDLAIGPDPANPLHDPCGNHYYQPGDWSTNCNSLVGGTYYIAGNWTNFKSAIIGNVIIMGNMEFKNGSQATVGSYAATVPPVAWKQYCNDWDYYLDNYDAPLNAISPAVPACFGSLNNTYRPTGLTKSINPAIHGFVYVGKNLSLPNGGGSDDLVHGAIVVKGTANIDSNSHCKIYYDPAVAQDILTTNYTLVRTSWQDITTPWPAALP